MGSSEQLKVGVVGTSTHVASTHLTYLTSHRRAAVAAVCGRNPARTSRTAQQFGIPEFYTDYATMLDQARLDAVVIGSPDDLHYAMVMAAIERGLHVICEKPLAQSAEEALRMFQRAEAIGVKHMTNFSWRWLPAQRYARHLIDEGRLGRIYDCTVVFRGGYGRDGSYAWRFDASRGDGVLGDLGSHAVDLARWYVGDVRRITASCQTTVRRSDPDGQPLESANDSAHLLLEFASGAHGSVTVSAVSHVGERDMEQRIVLHGENGTLEVDYTKPLSEIRFAEAPDGPFERLVIPDEFAGPHPDDPFSVFEHLSVGDRFFVDAVLDDLPVSPSFAEGVAVQRLLDAANLAARERRWVDI